MNYLWTKYKQNANPSEFIFEQRVKTNMQLSKKSEQRVKRNKQWAKGNKKWAKSNKRK